MCGLAGFASTERRTNEFDRKSAFTQLLQAAAWRGEDAAGIACVSLGKLDQAPLVFKKAMAAWDLTHMEPYTRLMSRLDDYGYVIGHARAATVDKWTYADQNAHPFQYGPVTLVHNGHIQNAHNIESGHNHPVDSAHVAGALSVVGQDEAGKVLERLVGGYALVWHDSRDGSLNFARNHQRPLYFCFVEGENTMFWGSELETIFAALTRNDFKVDGKFKTVSPGSHVKFEAGKLREYRKLPFENRQSQGHRSTTPSSVPWKGETRRLPALEGLIQNNEPDGKTTSEDKSAGTGTTEKQIPSLKPKSRRKQRAAKDKLQKLGLQLDRLACFVPESFQAYPNQRENYGSIMGTDKVHGLKWEIGHVKREVWQRVSDLGKIYGRIANIRKDARGKGHIIVCDYDPVNTKKFVLDKAAGGMPFQRPFRRKSSEPSVEKIYLGPDNSRVDEETWFELTKHGCGWCSADLPLDDHDSILWIGQLPSPICRSCTHNDEVLHHLGVKIA